MVGEKTQTASDKLPRPIIKIFPIPCPAVCTEAEGTDVPLGTKVPGREKGSRTCTRPTLTVVHDPRRNRAQPRGFASCAIPAHHCLGALSGPSSDSSSFFLVPHPTLPGNLYRKSGSTCTASKQTPEGNGIWQGEKTQTASIQVPRPILK